MPRFVSRTAVVPNESLTPKAEHLVNQYSYCRMNGLMVLSVVLHSTVLLAETSTVQRTVRSEPTAAAWLGVAWSQSGSTERRRRAAYDTHRPRGPVTPDSLVNYQRKVDGEAASARRTCAVPYPAAALGTHPSDASKRACSTLRTINCRRPGIDSRARCHCRDRIRVLRVVASIFLTYLLCIQVGPICFNMCTN